MCKKVGHYASKFEEELPTKTPKNGSSVEITNEEVQWNHVTMQKMMMGSIAKARLKKMSQVNLLNIANLKKP